MDKKKTLIELLLKGLSHKGLSHNKCDCMPDCLAGWLCMYFMSVIENLLLDEYGMMALLHNVLPDKLIVLLTNCWIYYLTDLGIL